MVITLEQVRDALDTYEGDYSNTSEFGAEALPHLETIIRTGNPLIASKAAYIVGLIQDSRSVDVLKVAAQSKFIQVRAAAAAGARYMHAEGVDDVLESLKNDSEEHVKKRALKSIELRRGPGG